ncbi:hypothetical protein PLICRDRAFT_37467 [Plicaturopsis crispa FD-325 SS-3]|nr:hypothetical protein PLICRDRAFT_37467 [Plicaturopsis crispa FD-325 SS-3]
MARVKKHSAPRIPRPPNSWILFRAATVQRLHASGQHLRNTQARLSQIIGPMWRAVDDETRLRFEEQAKRSEAEHRAKYPDYKFRPRFKGRKPRAPVFIKDFDKAHRPYCPDASFAPPIPAPPQYLSGPGAPPPSYPDPEYPIVWTLPTTLPENLAYRADSPVRHTPDLESEDDDVSSVIGELR